MPLLNKCCGCQLRTGTIVCCVYCMCLSLLSIITMALAMHVLSTNIDLLTSSDLPVTINDPSATLHIMYFVFCVDIGLYAFLLITAILILIGVKKYPNKRSLLLPFLIILTVLVVLRIIGGVIQIYAMSEMAGSLNSAMLIQIIMNVVPAVLNILCILCVVSYYQQLGQNNGRFTAKFSKLTEPILTEKVDLTMDFEADQPPPYADAIPSNDSLDEESACAKLQPYSDIPTDA